MQILAGDTALELGGQVRFIPSWLERARADALFAELRHSIAWTQGSIVLFGRRLEEPRLTAWFGEADYTYSGRTLRAAPWPACIDALRGALEREARSPFNAVLLNLYRGGEDSMGLHADDEPELGPDPTIASLSLGEPRRFVLQPKQKSARRTGAYTVELGHGSLLVMSGSCQHRYRHGVPKQAERRGERVNLTFRRVLACG